MKKQPLFSLLTPLCTSLLVVTLLAGCRGQTSSEPPLMLIRNMVDQTTYPAQSNSPLSTDVAPVGTVAVDVGHADARVSTGKDMNGQWVVKNPFQITKKFQLHGQDRFNIYCATCHGYAGHSDGLVTQNSGGTVRPADLQDKDRRAMPDGALYDAITNGVNNWNMPGFTEQMSVEDRWAVVAYVRALQLSEHPPESSHTAVHKGGE